VYHPLMNISSILEDLRSEHQRLGHAIAGPCVRRTGHPFAASGPRAPSQKIELVFSAGPKTVSGEPEESFDFHRSLGQGGTWRPARFTILRFSFRCGFMPQCRRTLAPVQSLAARDLQPRDMQRASYRECCAISIPLLPCIFIYQIQIKIPPWRQLRRFNDGGLAQI
jgi:hypothetical protein